MNGSYTAALSLPKSDTLNGSEKAVIGLAKSALDELFNSGDSAVAKYVQKPDADTIKYIVSKALEFVNRCEMEYFHDEFVLPLKQFIGQGA